MTIFAHSRNRLGVRHTLVDHLGCPLAEAFARKLAFRNGDDRPLDAGELATWGYKFHDAAKAAPAFGAYLAAAERGEPAPRTPHAAPSALAAMLWFSALRGSPAIAHLEAGSPLYEVILPVLGHHAGLSGAATCVQTVRTPDNTNAADSALAFLRDNKLLPPRLPQVPLLPGTRRDMLIRMVASCIFDADRLDTEAHFRPEAGDVRASWSDIGAIAARFSLRQEAFLRDADRAAAEGKASASLTALRTGLYRDALAAAEVGAGLYRLCAPTGAAKTRAYLGLGSQGSVKRMGGLCRVGRPLVLVGIG